MRRAFFLPHAPRNFISAVARPKPPVFVSRATLSTAESPASRLDKWLWAVRIFKTRSLAADACRAGSVQVNAHPVKPARDVRVGEQVIVHQGLIRRTLQVIAVPPSRVGAKRVSEYCTDLTPPEEFEKAKLQRVQQLLAREKGSGRPTKRDRRLLDQLLSRGGALP